VFTPKTRRGPDCNSLILTKPAKPTLNNLEEAAGMGFSTFLLAAAAVAASATPAPCAEFESEIAVVSDYRWRGVSLSDEEPSLQIEGTASFDNGTWLWGGANSVSADYGGSELGIGAGYTRELAGLEWTLGVTRYLYPGEEALDYTELALSSAVTFGAVSLSAGTEYVPEQSNYDEEDLYLWVGGEVALPRDARLYAQVGRDDGSMAPAPDAVDFTLGAAIAVSAVEFDLSYVEVDTVAPAWVLRIAYRP
jgi:uncharacterized protein (TIGR02001 family)